MKKATGLFRKFPTLGFAAMMLLLMGFEVLSSSCTKSKCPAFSDAEFDKWFPYTSGQQAAYLSNLGNKDTLRIGVSRSEAFTTYGSSSNCSSNASLLSFTATMNTPQFNVDYAIYSGGKRLYLTLYDLYLNGESIGETGIRLVPDNRAAAQYHPVLNLAGRTFQKVQVIQRDTVTNKAPGLYKIWLAQQTGVAAFEYYPSLEQFVKQ